MEVITNAYGNEAVAVNYLPDYVTDLNTSNLVHNVLHAPVTSFVCLGVR